jgi:SAM-dependent methyltransferase
MALDEVAAQYTQGNLLERIDAALAGAGIDPGKVTVNDLAPVDHFHTLGPRATVGLADAAELEEGDEVLDVGSGLGGPARMLAARYRCRVTAVDLTPEYCAVAQELNARTGLADRIVVQEANALALPFGDDTFDAVWTMHVTMNIEDKASLYDQFARVLKPGGKLAFFDLIAGEGDVIFPVPWADTPAINHLVDEQGMRALLSSAGFHVSLWEDLTAEGAAFFAGPPASQLSPMLLVKEMGPRMGNLRRNLEQGRVRAVRSVCSYPG